MVLGVIDYSFSTSMPLLVGSMIEMLLFSLALGYKIKTLSLEHTKTLTQLQAQNKILFLQSRYTSVGELIRNITHQWKEPLGEIGAIQTNLKSTLVFQGSVSKEKLLNAINLSHKIISHLAETIDTFYRFFRAKTTESQEFDITTEIDNLRKMVNYTFDSDQIALTCTYSERPISIYGHPNEFAHAILNIILNAKDVLIKRQIKHPWVNIDVSTSSSKVFITVSDNGGGILQ
jgi:signal transduction histidine kinase